MSEPEKLRVICVRCGAVLFFALYLGGLIEIKCHKCGALLRWPAACTEILVIDSAGKKL